MGPGLPDRKLAQQAEDLARRQFGQVDLAADGTLAAELAMWLEERELDVAATTLERRDRRCPPAPAGRPGIVRA
jgi:hypothetical protein